MRIIYHIFWLLFYELRINQGSTAHHDFGGRVPSGISTAGPLGLPAECDVSVRADRSSPRKRTVLCGCVICFGCLLFALQILKVQPYFLAVQLAGHAELVKVLVRQPIGKDKSINTICEESVSMLGDANCDNPAAHVGCSHVCRMELEHA